MKELQKEMMYLWQVIYSIHFEINYCLNFKGDLPEKFYIVLNGSVNVMLPKS